MRRSDYGAAALPFASGFAAAKLRTEMVRAPVLAHELRYAAVTGFVETHELRDKGRARLTLRVISLDHLAPNDRHYRVRVSLPVGDAAVLRIGQAVSLQAFSRCLNRSSPEVSISRARPGSPASAPPATPLAKSRRSMGRRRRRGI